MLKIAPPELSVPEPCAGFGPCRAALFAKVLLMMLIVPALFPKIAPPKPPSIRVACAVLLLKVDLAISRSVPFANIAPP